MLTVVKCGGRFMGAHHLFFQSLWMFENVQDTELGESFHAFTLPCSEQLIMMQFSKGNLFPKI